MSKEEFKFIRKYPKVYRLDNYKTKDGIGFQLNKEIIIQEKLDGSNLTIEYDVKQDNIKAFSRNLEIPKVKPGNFTGVWDYIEKNINFDKVDFIKEAKFVRLHGEWLKQGKIGYNKNEKYNNQFYLFDIRVIAENDEKKFLSWKLVKIIADLLGIKTVPYIINTPYKTARELIETPGAIDGLVENQRSILDKEYPMEGIVVKNNIGQRIKFVSSKFKERRHTKKNKKQPIIVVSPDVINEARINKYIGRLKDDNIIDSTVNLCDGKIISIIFKNMKLLVDDLFEEELDGLVEILKKQIKRSAGRSMRAFLNKLQEGEKNVNSKKTTNTNR